jgi:hypothetical protein
MTVEQTAAAYPSTFPILQGKVALVTGAGSGIGRAGPGRGDGDGVAWGAGRCHRS